MNILIDTHIALWAMYAPERLSEDSAGYLTYKANTIYCSLVSAWEVEIKNSIGKLDVLSAEFVRDAESMGFRILPIECSHILGLVNVEIINGHKDPFDRLLVSQAMVERCMFLSEDRKILQYPYNCILK